jgi:hypothetical protein
MHRGSGPRTVPKEPVIHARRSRAIEAYRPTRSRLFRAANLEGHRRNGIKALEVNIKTRIKMNSKQKLTFENSVNWEYVHAHQRAGKVNPGPWCERIIEHARKNGYMGKITEVGACRIINRNLY